jgi:hypothetical protein
VEERRRDRRRKKGVYTPIGPKSSLKFLRRKGVISFVHPPLYSKPRDSC